MSAANPTNRMTLADALRALPAAAPTRDVWPKLAAQLAAHARTSRRRYFLPAALAASIALAVIAMQFVRHAPKDPVAAISASATVADSRASSKANDTTVIAAMNAANSTNANATANRDAQLAVLQSRSRALEGWLRRTGKAGSPLQGQDLAAAIEIENLIGLVDVELAAPGHANPLPLWQRRVALLDDLTTLRYSNYQLAAGGTAIAAANRID